MAEEHMKRWSVEDIRRCCEPSHIIYEKIDRLPEVLDAYKNTKFSPIDIFGTLDEEWLFTLNNFPYYVEENVTHWVLWRQSPEQPENWIEFCEEKIQERFKGYEYVWFVNPDQFKSVPEFFHAHIFIREGF